MLAGGKREKKMEAGRKENVFLESTACVCDEWRGSVGIGCW